MAASASILARKLPRESSLPPADTATFRLLCWLTSGLALLAFAVSVMFRVGVLVPRASELCAWGILVALADLGAIRVWRNVHIGLAFPLLLAAGFLFGPVISGAIAFVASLDSRELRREMSFP